MNLRAIPPHVPFLDALATWWLDRAPDHDPLAAADGLILLPTRRAARALSDAFLRRAEGQALLLPRIAALGALDEAPLALAGGLSLLPAVAPAVRLAVLSRMVMALDGDYGAPATADSAWQLAIELAALIDEAHRAEIVLAETLPNAVDAGYAEHWARVVLFLRIVTRAWPAWLAENGLMDGAARAVKLLDLQRVLWEQRPPSCPVVVAGTTGGVRSVCRLMHLVARQRWGTVILPGLDLAMGEDVWARLDDGHPQAGLARLLRELGATRGDVSLWGETGATVPPDRCTTLWRALRPAQALGEWRDDVEVDVQGLMRLEPADAQEEAVAIALVLREALETPNARAALVTPDRALAGRVASELARYEIVADDSAGEPLAETPPGAFLRLLARSVAEGLGPVPLLAVLKHPLAGLGMAAVDCRLAARALEVACLRGPAPAPGLDGLRRAVERTGDPGLRDLLDRLEARMAPVMQLVLRTDATPAEALAALLVAAEGMAATESVPGAARLWSGEEGSALAAHLSELQAALPVLPAQPVATLPGLLDASMEGAVVRGRRALRGRDGFEHPRVAIFGLLEARLQSVDVIVLGGLVESVWPPGTDPGPWMSRPMRITAGLTSPEERVGQMAHDFVMAACAAPRAILSCPRRRDGAPAVPARWLVRLEAYLKGRGMALPRHPAVAWARMLDQPHGAPCPVSPPCPRPPVQRRPRRLSVTEIETWLRDPYAIYAKHVLKLRALAPLEEFADAADYGSIVHKAMAAFLGALGPTYPPHAASLLRGAMDRALDDAGMRPALAAWWRPRLHRIADWAAEEERKRRQAGPHAHIASEVLGKWVLPGLRIPFVLTGRADRIERRPDGDIAILDYKTGAPPTEKDVAAGRSPQLPLEAAMAGQGAFGAELIGRAVDLTYWRLSGGFQPGQVCSLFKGDEARIAGVVAEAQGKLGALIAAFDDPDRAYLSRPHPAEAPRFSDYAQLARVAEWAAAADAP